MRNSSKNLTLVLSLMLIFLISCQDRSKKDEAGEEVTDEASKEVKEPTGIISLDEAKMLCDNYEARRVKAIIEFEMAENDTEEFIPTQFIDFDLKTIKQYIKYVEKEARKAKVKPDSLRIYLGNYGAKGSDPNKNTVFILPTATIAGDHGGFYIDSEGKAKLIRNYWPKNENGDQEGEPKSKASFLPNLNPFLYQNQSMILNYGTGGPPPTGDF